MKFLLALLFTLPLAAQDPATVTGRLLDQDGAPIVGARIELTAALNPPGTWKDVEATSDARGRFRLRCAAAEGLWLLTSITAPGLAEHQAPLRDVEPGETRDLGDILLLPAGVVVGRIVDSSGDALPLRGWRITARLDTGAFYSKGAVIDPTTGEFRLEDLPAGVVHVSGQHGSLETDTVETRVSGGGEAHVELRFTGPDPGRRVAVRIRAPRGMFFADAARVVIRDAAGVEHEGNGEDFGFETVFDDLEPGSYTLVIEDPRYQRHEEEVLTGVQTNVQLVGAGAVRLEVVDAETGEPIPAYELEVVYPHTNSSPNSAVLVSAASPPPPGGLVEGIVPGRIELVVTTPGRPDVQKSITLAPGKELPVRFEVPAAQGLQGTVLGPDGRPESLDVRIEWTPGEEHGHTMGGTMHMSGREIPKVREIVTPSPTGQFQLEAAGAGKHALRVRWSEWLTEDLVVDVPLEEPLTIRRPPSGFVVGHLDAPGGLDTGRITLTFTPKRDRRSMRTSVLMAQSMSRGSSTAFGYESLGDRFRAGPLPVGDFLVNAELSNTRRRGIGGMMPEEDESLARVEVVAGEEVELDLDVSHVFPCEARVALDSGDIEVTGVRVALRSLEGRKEGSPGRVIGELEAGVRYQVCLSHRPDGWSYESDVYITAVPGRRQDVEVQVPLIERRVRFVDPEGAPLAQRPIVWACGLLTGSATTDAAGHLDLTLVEGPVVLGRSALELQPQRWTAGAETLVVTLPGE